MLRVSGLHAHYQRIPVLDDVAFQVDKGEIVAIIGSNGAGKSTLLRAICGLVPFVSGDVRLGAHSLVGLAPHEVASLGVSLIPEGRGIFPSLTVRENLLMGAYQKRLRTGRDVRLERELERFPVLRQRLRQRAGTLSGGEQQMLALARGLLADPRLILLDEPSLGLGPLVVDGIFSMLHSLRASDVALVVVEQDVGRSLEISDRGYILEKGRITLAGSGGELLDNPYVKEAFLGVA